MTFQTPASAGDIEHRFAFHPATTEEKRAEHGSVRASCRRLAQVFDQDLPPGREKSLAITKLEEAMFWANAAVARSGAAADVTVQRSFGGKAVNVQHTPRPHA